jgi:hypothetical protein
MAMGRNGRCRNHPAARNANDARRIRFHVLNQFQSVLDQLARADPLQVFRLKLTSVGMVVSTVTTDGTDAGSAREFPATAIRQQDFLPAIRSPMKDAQLV